MNGEDMKAKIDSIMARFGPDVEFLPHGPGQEGAFLSGFGPECNWYLGEVTLEDGKKIMACFLHGLPTQFEGETGQRFAVLTGAFPLRSQRIKQEEGDF